MNRSGIPGNARITFGGKAWATLRDDQQAYAEHLMRTWHAVNGMWYDRWALRRAIRKTLEQRP